MPHYFSCLRATLPHSRNRALAGLDKCRDDVEEDGSLRAAIGREVQAASLRATDILTRCRTLLSEIDNALSRVVESAGSRRCALSSLVTYVRNFNPCLQSAMSIEVCAVREFEFAGGVDFVCDAFNSDGQTLPLLNRLRGILIGAYARGLSSSWVASLVTASHSYIKEAMSELDLVPESSGCDTPADSDSSESYVSNASLLGSCAVVHASKRVESHSGVDLPTTLPLANAVPASVPASVPAAAL